MATAGKWAVPYDIYFCLLPPFFFLLQPQCHGPAVQPRAGDSQEPGCFRLVSGCLIQGAAQQFAFDFQEGVVEGNRFGFRFRIGFRLSRVIEPAGGGLSA